jgi:hypothetical protein
MSKRARAAEQCVKRYDVGDKEDQKLTPTHVRFTRGTAKGRWLDLNDLSSIDVYYKDHPRLNGYIEIKTEEGVIFGYNRYWDLMYTIIMRDKGKKSLKIWLYT